MVRSQRTPKIHALTVAPPAAPQEQSSVAGPEAESAAAKVEPAVAEIGPVDHVGLAVKDLEDGDPTADRPNT